MKHRHFFHGVLASLGILILILDSQTALEGARSGIALCLETVIPSLFPFFVFSVLLTGTLTGMQMPLFRPLGRLCRIPPGTEAILICGFLGGYPSGAKNVSLAYHTGNLSQRDAERMLAFCNNAGPAFLFGMVASAFPEGGCAWALWIIHIISAVFTAMILPENAAVIKQPLECKSISIAEALQSATGSMATVCGWVVLFRVILAFLETWILWLFPTALQVLLAGLLELSNGCCRLCQIPDIRLRFLICSGILAFGGLCVTMQTVSAAGGLRLRLYFCGKLLQTLCSLTLSWGLVYRQWSVFLLLPLTFFLLRKSKKRVAFTDRLVYNGATF